MCSPWRGREEGQVGWHLWPKLQQSEHTEVDRTGRDRIGWDGMGWEGQDRTGRDAQLLACQQLVSCSLIGTRSNKL